MSFSSAKFQELAVKLNKEQPQATSTPTPPSLSRLLPPKEKEIYVELSHLPIVGYVSAFGSRFLIIPFSEFKAVRAIGYRRVILPHLAEDWKSFAVRFAAVYTLKESITRSYVFSSDPEPKPLFLSPIRKALPVNMTAGFIAGSFVEAMAYPYPRLKALLDSHVSGVMGNDFLTTLSETGWTFHVNCGFALLRAGVQRAFFFGLYDTINPRLQRRFASSFSALPLGKNDRYTNPYSFCLSSIVGCLASFISIVASYPIGTLHAELALLPNKYCHGYRHCARTVIEEVGIRGMYKGMNLVVWKGSAMGLTLAVLDHVVGLYGKAHEQSWITL